MKKFSLTLIAVAALASLMAHTPVAKAADKTDNKSAASTGEKSDKPAKARAAVPKRMAEELSLTADQKGKLKPILEDEAQKIKTLRADTSLSAKEKRAKLAEFREATNAKVKPILTPDQATKWEKMRKEAPAKGKKKEKKKDK